MSRKHWNVCTRLIITNEKEEKITVNEGSLSGRGDQLIQRDSWEEQTWAAGELGHLGETLL